MTTNSKFFEFISHLDELKHLKRTGWVDSKVPEPETVASHMYRMAVLAMTLDLKDVDSNRMIKMALVHDIGEAIIGDITPHMDISDTEKFRLENDAVKQISLCVPHIQDEIYALWREYEAHETIEAKVVKQLDKIDLLYQALSYETKFPDVDLDRFFDNTIGVFSTEPFLTWDREIREKHKQLKIGKKQ